MELIDTHAHLYLKQFNSDRVEAVQRAIDSGVQKMLLPNIDSTTVDSMMTMSTDFPSACYPMIGLHPSYVKENNKIELEIVERHLKSSTEFCGVGEIGLDFYWDKTFTKEQETAFRTQIEWAKEYKLPVVIHCRNSFEETISIVEELSNNELTGIFHCFGGRYKDAERIISSGFYLGIGGVVTFKNSGLGEVVKSIGLSYIVLETDAPYLAPDPFRGKRNESAYIVHVAQKIASLHNISVEEVAEITSQNAKKIFRL